MSEIKTIALIGSPNSGKTTLYNWLTGSHFKTVNYPGATVEYSLGEMNTNFISWGKNLSQIQFMDTPGVYSLTPKSEDEVVTLNALYDSIGKPQVVIAVLDGTQLKRHLLIAEQLKQTQFPQIIVVTMNDLLVSEGLKINLEKLKSIYNCPVVLFDGVLGKGLKELIAEIDHILESPLDINSIVRPETWNIQKYEEKQKEIENICRYLFEGSDEEKLKNIFKKTYSWDSVLLHPVWGSLIFFFIMAFLFSSIFWFSKPFMEMIDQVFSWAGDFILSRNPHELWAQFLSEGLLAGFSAILVFVPQIFILFFGVGLLESSGYLARAATLVDRPFSKLGLSGRSFVPFLSGFACAVPAMIATRNIGSSRDRLITNLVIPLLTCSARLPVYALLIAFLFQEESSLKAGVALAILYLLSMVVGSLSAAILNRIIQKNQKSIFMMELPLYRRPKLKVIFSQTWNRTSSYIKKAGPVIFVLSVVLWGLSRFPNYQMEDKTQQIQSSYLGQMGQYFEPVFEPMGLDWRVGVGLISAFTAREVFVSSMAVVFSIADDNEETQQQSLLNAMKSSKNSQGGELFTAASVGSLIVFFMIAMQCMSTFAVSIRENGSFKVALAQMIGLNLLAYILAVGTYQILLRFV